MTFTATPAGIVLPSLPEGTRFVDVAFDTHRVWSLDLEVDRPGFGGKLAWPPVLASYLIGSTVITLTDSQNHQELARAQVAFTSDPVTTAVLDDEGVPLVVNKWGRLGKSLESGNAGVQERIIARSAQLIDELSALGLRPFVSCGTLLGAVREGALLPHDDDADLGYLSSFTNPVDVAREGFEVGHQLEALGYELVRHSATHMQLIYRTENGSFDHYIDVFATFFSEDGHINQPFPVRGPMRPEQMLPFSTVTVRGTEFPAPADPEHWLTVNYGADWRIPNPGYRIVTPRTTARRFDNWFGLFHFNRDFWNEFYREHDSLTPSPWQAGEEWIYAQRRDLTSPWLIDLGCGAGALSARFQDESGERHVVAADYAESAIATAQRAATEVGYSTAHVNLHRTNSLALPERLGIEGAFDIVANHVLDQAGPDARHNALRLVRMALRSGGSARATLNGANNAGGDAEDPRNWGVKPSELEQLAARLGLRATCEPIRSSKRERRRRPYGVSFSLDTEIKEDA